MCQKTVYNWVERWTNRDTVAAHCLADQPRSGRPSTLCDQVAATVTKLLATKPRNHGYRQAEVPITGNRRKAALYAALNIATGARCVDLAPRWHGDSFREHLRHIRWQ